MSKKKINIEEIVAPNDVLRDDLTEVKGGVNWIKVLLDVLGLDICGSGCDEGEVESNKN